MMYFDLFITFFKIGAFSFGGGYAMIPFFEKEILLNNWASISDYIKVIAISQVLPGPFAIDSSGFIGYKVAGLTGAIIASVAISLPSFLASILITRFYVQFKSNNYFQLVFQGVRPAVLGLLISASYILGFQPLVSNLNDLFSFTLLKAVLLISSGFLILKYLKLNPLILIIGFGILGIILF